MPQYNGVWTIQAAAQAQSNQQWVTDPNFRNTTLLLQADSAANGAQNNTFLDSSSNSFAITRTGNVTQGTFTPFSQSAGRWSNYFGGSTDYIAFTSIAAYGLGTSNYTIECNVSFNSTAGNQRIFCIGASGTDGLVLQYTGGTGVQLFSAASGSATVFTYAFTPVVGTWYNFTVVRSGTGTNQVVLYLNGVSVATGTSSASVGQNAALIAGISWNSTYTVNGYINNFRLSNTARYSANFNPATSPFLSDANTILLTCQNNRFVDTSSTGNTLTIGGTPSVQPFSPFAPQFQWTAPVIGGSGFFDGTGDYLFTTSNAALVLNTGSWTIEAFAYLTGGTSYRTVLSKRTGSTAEYEMGVDPSGNFYLYIGSTVYATTTSVPLNSWNHLCITCDGTNIRMFQNGILTRYNASLAAGNGTGNLSTGVEAGTATQNWVGYISNERIVKGSVVSAYSTASTTVGTVIFTPPTAPLTAITNTSYLLSFTNAGIYDAAMDNVLETVGNAQVSTSVVKYGSGSMYFDGTGDYLRIPSSPVTSLGSGDWTIEFWLYRVGSGNQIIYDQRSAATQVAATIFNDGTNILRFFVNGVNRISDTNTFPLATWTHVAVSKANSLTRMFVNGAQVGSTYADTNTYLNNPIFIGAQYDTASGVNGYIDDLRVSSFARYISNFIPPLVALPRQ